MRTIHFSDARNHLKAVIDQAIDDHDAILMESIEQLRRGEGKERKLIEPDTE